MLVLFTLLRLADIPFGLYCIASLVSVCACLAIVVINRIVYSAEFNSDLLDGFKKG